MRRVLTCLALFGATLLAPLSVSAQTAVLLAVGDATQLSELQLAKVMADDSSLWLSVRLHGPSRLALVVAEAGIESAPAAHAWLRALDYATRVRVAAPPGVLSGCASSEQYELADSGLPEPQRVAALEVSSASSELELRRRLADAGLPVDVGGIAQFTSDAEPPFRVVIYDVPAFGGGTEALRLVDRGHAAELPQIALSGARLLPLSLIALAKEGVLPLGQESADPSEFPVAYRALDHGSDYLSARGGWLAQNPTRWLNEVQASTALFAWAVFPANGQIAPVVSHYFEQLSGTPTGSCEARVRAAHARASVNAADFVCDGADDLAQSLTEVGFADLRLSRFFGMVSADGEKFRVAPGLPRSPLLLATDFDDSGCPPDASLPGNAASDVPDSRTPPPISTPPVVGAPDDAYYDPTPAPASQTEGSCTFTFVDSGTKDSCSGNSSSGDASGDSCSGDSSSDDSGPDSCSGDASDSSSDSCDGDSSDSSDDSSGCGKSEYDGDTCSGNSARASGKSARSASVGLRSGSAATDPRPRPRQVRLSLLTLLAAALALPLRRLRASR
ncbi:MAG: hypothetical protein WDO74_09470 [Pseudomonadota bacterium]